MSADWLGVGEDIRVGVVRLYYEMRKVRVPGAGSRVAWWWDKLGVTWVRGQLAGR